MSTHCWQTRSDSRRWCNPVTSVGSPGEMTGARVRFYGQIFFHQQMSSFFFANKIVNDVPSGLEIQAAGCSATGHVCGQQGQRRSSRQEAWATHVTNEFVSFIKLVCQPNLFKAKNFHSSERKWGRNKWESYESKCKYWNGPPFNQVSAMIWAPGDTPIVAIFSSLSNVDWMVKVLRNGASKFAWHWIPKLISKKYLWFSWWKDADPHTQCRIKVSSIHGLHIGSFKWQCIQTWSEDSACASANHRVRWNFPKAGLPWACPRCPPGSVPGNR